MADDARKKRREMGMKARDIFRQQISVATKQLQRILTPVKMELVEARIISEEAIDLGMLGVGQLQMASNLYGIIMTTMEVMPSKFPNVVEIFYKFPELSTIAEEMEEKGIAAGLMSSQTRRAEQAPPTQKQQKGETELSDALSDPPTLMKFLENVAVEIPAKWRNVGIALGVNPAELDGFQLQYMADPMRCFERVFEAWKNKKSETFTWSTLIKFLSTKFIGEDVLASSLRERLIEA